MLEEKRVAAKTEALRLLAVIVLYRLSPSESNAFKTLQTTISRGVPGEMDVKILLYDNTPGGCEPGQLPEGVQYEAAQRNAGLAAAYNRALEIAEAEGFDWLLTLDQDTTLPPDYLSRMSKIALDVGSDNRVAAIVPRLSDAGRPLSPSYFSLWGGSGWPSGLIGVSNRETHAYNSASLFRVSALKQIGGFSPYFWLDFLDAYVYRQFHLHGRTVYVAGDIQVEHELSLLHRKHLKVDRFRNILQAESAFCDLYGGPIRGFALTGRTLARILRQRMRGDNPAIRRTTWNVLNKRVFQSKAHRIQDWKNEMEHRIRCSSVTGQSFDCPENRRAISVCMAAYNGERYITAQLQSILCQLADGDEVIVVDDASTDGTRDCVRAVPDKRIRLIENKENRGISYTFEDAIQNASNSILFLSDQDDLWDPKKVATILKAFETNPDVMVVATDSALMDEDESLLCESYFAGRGKFRPGLLANLIHNRYGGCTLAFRAKIMSEILPFPHKYEVLHDIWIGVRNSLSHGGALYIDQPLVLCRRHSANATGKAKLSTMRKIQVRLHLLAALVEFSVRRVMDSVRA